MRLFYPKATFVTFRGSLRPLRRVAARALERFAFCATSLRFTSFIFGAYVRRAPSEPVSVCSVVKNPASNSHFKKHPLSAAYFDALQSSKWCAPERAEMRILGVNDAHHFTKRVYCAKLCGACAKLCAFTRSHAKLGRNQYLKCDYCA